MDQENIMFFKNQDDLYTIVDQYLNTRYLGYKDSYNYYDTDVNKILLFEKSNDEYIVRYYDVNKMAIVPLQLKINNFYFDLLTFTNNDRVMFIYNDDKKLFWRCREIWNKITGLIDINSAPNFGETNLDDDDNDDEFISAYEHKNTSFVEVSYRNKLIIVLDSIFHDYLQSSIVQYRC